MHRLKKIDDVIERIESGIVVLLFSSLIILIIFNILSRNIFDTSFQFIFAYAPAIVLWIALMGASIALRHRRHIKLELLLRHLPVRFSVLAERAKAFFGLTVMTILFFASLFFVKNEITLFGIRGWVTVVFPLFFFISGFRYLIAMISAWGATHARNRGTPGNSPYPPSTVQ